MLSWIVRSIICDEFRKHFFYGEYTYEGKPRTKGMIVDFSISKKIEGMPYPRVQLLLYGEYNYIGVYERESGGNWIVRCYHDSCWATDGVERFIGDWEKELITIGRGGQHWYELMDVSDGFREELKEIRKKRYG